jgi:hypothetical protein
MIEIEIESRLVFDGDDLIELLRSMVRSVPIGEWEGSWMQQFYLACGSPPLGDPFEFGERPDDAWFISPEVPEAHAQVDLMRAWEVAQADGRACRLVLDGDAAIEDVLRAYVNTVRWMRFWADRCPDPAERVKLGKALEDREAKLQRFRARARRRLDFEVMEGLEHV